MAIGLSIATSIRSFDFIYRITSDNFYAITGLLTLESGVFIWFYLFKKAESAWQMTIAGSMIAVSLLGIGVASIGDVFLKSTVTSQPEQFWIDVSVAFVSGLFVLNMLALVCYEITDVAFWQNFKNKLAQIKINEQATRQIDQNAERIAGTVALHRGDNWANQILAQEGIGGIKQLPAGQLLATTTEQKAGAEQRHPLRMQSQTRAIWQADQPQPQPSQKPIARTVTTPAADGAADTPSDQPHIG